MIYAKAHYTKFHVEVDYECPECGYLGSMAFDNCDVYAEQEYGLDIECHGCGSEITLSDVEFDDRFIGKCNYVERKHYDEAIERYVDRCAILEAERDEMAEEADRLSAKIAAINSLKG